MSEPTTLRDAIAAAFDEPPEAAASVPADPAPVEQESPAAEPTTLPTTDSGPDLNTLAEGEKGADNENPSEQLRDEHGKFAKPEGVQPGPKPGPKQAGERPPASWRPDVREHWGQLPESVRGEIARRETEVQRTLQETAEARKTAEAVMRTIAPYEAFIRAENSSPLQAIDNLMSTAARLRTGTAPELAQMVAGIVKQFGVGRFGNNFIEILDSALAGRAPQGGTQNAALDEVLNQKLAPLQGMLNQFQQAQLAQQNQMRQSAQTEVEDFLSKAEFGNDVRDQMADLIEIANRKGQALSLVEAYKKACLMNDSVRSVMAQRIKAQGAQQNTKAAQKAKAAAVSVSGGAPVGALQSPAVDVRSAIEAAIMQTSR